MKFEILILTQPSRAQFLARLLAVLKPQVEEHPEEVKVTVRMFDPTWDLGTNRQLMREQSAGEWSAFIDDDDLIPASYVSTILPLLDRDYVGFQLQMYSDGEKQKPTYHSLRYKEWNADQHGYYRHISHLNPIRRDLALRVKMSGGFGEDERWSTQLHNLEIVKTEHFINEVMYYYYWRSNKNDYPGPAFQIPVTQARYNPIDQQQFIVGQRRPVCPECGSTATALAGGMRRCNQCAASWV